MLELSTMIVNKIFREIKICCLFILRVHVGVQSWDLIETLKGSTNTNSPAQVAVSFFVQWTTRNLLPETRVLPFCPGSKFRY